VNLLDLGVLVLLVLAAINGYRRGAALQLTAYAGLLIGLLIGALIAPAFAGLMASSFSSAAVAMIVLLSMAAIGDAVGWFIGVKVWTLARRSILGTVDAVGGSLVAVVAVLLTTWFIAFNLVNGPFAPLSNQIRGSAVVRTLDRSLPRPPAVLAEVRQFLNRFGFPEVFAGLPPAPAGPVRGPTKGQAKAAAAAAEASTVKVVGQACGAIQEGSGFVAADDYVVTNAHVVAGMPAPKVQVQNGATLDATTVLFNPRLDIAVLRVDQAPGAALHLRAGDVGRGATGAVLGYPGGGSLTYGPAAVRRELDAVGRDIYGRDIVRRNVYELQAKVRPGNSGGPLVLLKGDVAGVVFAASTTDSGIGYALTSTEVRPLLRAAEGRSAPVSTQDCAR
jgi:S1-C subfamily serine protease